MIIPLSEYPRPQMRRESCRILNGYWDYAISSSPEAPGEFEGKILVPYSPETKQSGVERQLLPGQWLHYRLLCPKEDSWLEESRLLLHFGAVDYFCRVIVNGTLCGEHKGGYLPFTVEVTEAWNKEGENEIRVSVQDPSDTGCQARGKQKLSPGGMFYPAQSGIWQTVWMEEVPRQYIRRLSVIPDLDACQVKVSLWAEGAAGADVVVRKEGEVIARGRAKKAEGERKGSGSENRNANGSGIGNVSEKENGSAATMNGSVEKAEIRLEIPLRAARVWSPEDPFLYDLEICLPSSDKVESYFALRKFSMKKDRNGIPRFALNGHPYFLNGLLDQGYFPEGLYTPPSDEALETEIRTVKDLGFNLLRKHAKVECDRWYYHCDRIGMIVFQDMVNGGETYPMWFLAYVTNFLHPLIRTMSDRHPYLLARRREEGRVEYERELEEYVQALGNHPCIACWVPFNEGWGQFDTRRIGEKLKMMDPSRLVDQASGWYDQGYGDFLSIHNYFYPLKIKADRERITALTEFGGISWPCPGHTKLEKVYGYGKTASSGEELTAAYRKLIHESVLPQMKNGLSAVIYTQVSDVEEEVNGLMTYDREVVKMDADAVRECGEALALAFKEYVRDE